MGQYLLHTYRQAGKARNVLVCIKKMINADLQVGDQEHLREIIYTEINLSLLHLNNYQILVFSSPKTSPDFNLSIPNATIHKLDLDPTHNQV